MKRTSSSFVTLAILVSLLILCYFTYSADAALRINHFFIPDEARLRQQHRTHLYRSQSWYIMRRASNVGFRVQLDSELSEGQSMSLQIAPYSIIDRTTVKINHLGAGNYDIQLMIAADAPVGIFSVGLRLSNQNTVRQLPKQVAVLFNPWSPSTDEYFPRPAELSEYIEQEHGITFRGSTHQVQDVRWYLGVFSQETLSVTLYFINRLNQTERQDPAQVSRHLTRMSAYQQTVPDGLMEGKWEGGFGGGVNPSSWGDSTSIFRTYIAQGMNTVRYAQCWVFGAVLASMLRTIGLASLQISTFDSTHEYSPEPERNGLYWQRIGRYFDERYNFMVAETGKIWNFHSWNLVYFMNRHAQWPYNLPDWQNVDATPQEFSREGDYRLGPAPLKAVRENKKMVLFDTSFVISEVSARHHSFLVSCPYAFGGGQRLPAGCKVTRDLGPANYVASGTYIVGKHVQAFMAQPWTHMFSTRHRSPAEDPSILARFAAVRAFDALRNDDPTGMSALVFDPEPATSSTTNEPANTFSSMNNTVRTFNTASSTVLKTRDIVDSFEDSDPVSTHDILQPGVSAGDDTYVEEDSNLLYNWHDESQIDFERVNAKPSQLHPTEISLHQYENTGIAMSVIIPQVEFGKPLEIYLNFACEDQTTSFAKQLERRDLTTKVITLQVDPKTKELNGVTDEDEDLNENNNNQEEATTAAISPLLPDYKLSANDVTSCPKVAAVSFHLDLRLTDYTSREIGQIADVDGNVILHNKNGFFESYKIVVNDYVEKALKSSQAKNETVPEYVRAIVMATDHTTDPQSEIIMIAERKACIKPPPVTLLASTTNIIVPRANIVKDQRDPTGAWPAIAMDDVIVSASSTSNLSPANTVVAQREIPVSVALTYANKMPFTLTDVKIRFSADNLGFDTNIVHIGELKPGQQLRHYFSWNAITALDGEHVFNAIVESAQLQPTLEQLIMNVNSEGH